MSEPISEEKIMLYKVKCKFCSEIIYIISHQGVEPRKDYICANCLSVIHKDRIIEVTIRKDLGEGKTEGYKDMFVGFEENEYSEYRPSMIERS